MSTGFRPIASASLPNEPESSTSNSADTEPSLPSVSATALGSSPDARSAGGSAVPMQPKHADCSPAVKQSSATGGGRGSSSSSASAAGSEPEEEAPEESEAEAVRRSGLRPNVRPLSAAVGVSVYAPTGHDQKSAHSSSRPRIVRGRACDRRRVGVRIDLTQIDFRGQEVSEIFRSNMQPGLSRAPATSSRPGCTARRDVQMIHALERAHIAASGGGRRCPPSAAAACAARAARSATPTARATTASDRSG